MCRSPVTFGSGSIITNVFSPGFGSAGGVKKPARSHQSYSSVSTTDMSVRGTQLAPSYVAGHYFRFMNSSALGTVALTADQNGKFALFTVVEPSGATHKKLVPFQWQANVPYFPLVQQTAPGVWHASVLDTTAGAWRPIGQLTLPAEWGKLSPVSVTMLPWYGSFGESCSSYPRADVLFYPPIGFSGGTATVATLLTSGGSEFGNCKPQNTTFGGVWAHYGFGV